MSMPMNRCRRWMLHFGDKSPQIVSRVATFVGVIGLALAIPGRSAHAVSMCTSSSGLIIITPCQDYYGSSIGQHGVETLYYSIENDDGIGHTFRLQGLCDGTYIVSCRAFPYYPPTSLTVPAYYTSLAPTLTITAGDADLSYATVSLRFTDASTLEQIQTDTYVEVYGGLTVDGSLTNADYLSPALCALNCFDASYAHRTAAFVTLDSPRDVTLVYREERAHPRPILAALVSNIGNSTQSMTGVTFKVQVNNGSYATFVQNGATTLNFSGWLGRFAGQFDASTYTSTANVFPLVFDVTATFADTRTSHRTGTGKVAVVSPNWFNVAPGWGIAGVQKISCSLATTGCLIADGDGTAVWFSGGVGTQGPDYSTLTSDATYYYRTYLDGTVVRFTIAGGLMNQITDPAGRVTQFGYDGSNRLTSIQDPVRVARGAGRYIALTYDSNGLRAIADTGGVGTGRIDSLFYSSGRVTILRGPDGKADTLSYDSNGRLASVSDRRGGVTQYGYDSNSWKLTSVSTPSVPIDNGSGGTSSQTVTTTFTPWQTAGLPVGTATGNPADTSTTYAYVTDPLSHQTRFTVDRYGQPLKTIDPLSHVTDIKRVGLFPKTIKYPDNSVDSLTYSGGLLTGERPAGGKWTTYTYDTSHRLTQVTKVTRVIERHHYNSSNQLDTLWTPGALAVYSYDATTKQVASVTDTSGHTTTTHYNTTTWNADSTAAPGSRWTKATFDTYGRTVTTQTVGQPVQTIGYDDLNRPTRVANGVGTDTVAFRYDPLYRTSVVNQKGEVIDSVEYNVLGWVTARHDPNNLAIQESYRYSKLGQVTSLTTRRGQAISMTYDNAGRPTARNTPNGNYSFSYTNPNTFVDNGTYDQASYGGTTVQHFVDATTGVDSVMTSVPSSQWGSVVHYAGVDTLGATATLDLSTSFGDPPPRTFTSDSLSGRLIKLGFDYYITSFAYNSDGERTTTTWPWAEVRSEGYTSVHGRMSAQFSKPNTAAALNRLYRFDTQNRIQWITATGAATQERFAYDSVGQLVAWERWSGCSSSTLDSAMGTWYSSCTTRTDSTGYAYDRAGNRTDHSGSYGTGNRISAFNGYTYVHDSAGRVIKKSNGGSGTKLYAWDAEDHLLSVTDSVSGNVVSFDYDAAGHVYRRKLNGTVNGYWLYDGDQLVVESDQAAGKLWNYAYEPGADQPFAVSDWTSLAFYQRDERGNVIGEHDGAGNVTATVSYDPWGVPTVTSGTLKGTLRWKGLHYESGTTIGGSGLYYMRARWYDPDLGRFLSEDPLGFEGSGVNQYAFAGNDPINGHDPTGLRHEVCEYTHHYAYDSNWNLIDDWRTLDGCWEEADFGDGFSFMGGGGGVVAAAAKPKPRPAAPARCANSIWPSAFGISLGGSAELGVGAAGVAGTASGGGLVFYNGTSGWTTGSFASGGVTAYAGNSVVGKPAQTNGSFVLGGYLGGGAAIVVTNAKSVQQLAGPFKTLSLNVGVGPVKGSIQLSYGGGIWELSVSPPIPLNGGGIGLSGSQMTTNTVTKGSGCR